MLEVVVDLDLFLGVFNACHVGLLHGVVFLVCHLVDVRTGRDQGEVAILRKKESGRIRLSKSARCRGLALFL